MNSFEEYTVIIGLLAVLLEGISYLRKWLHNLRIKHPKLLL